MRDPVKVVPGHPPLWRDRVLTAFRRRNWRGFLRLYDLLKPPAGRREFQVRCKYGAQFLLTPWDSVDSHVIAEGFYESEVLEAVRPALARPDAVLWVVGANFGLHAITAKTLHPQARIIAFEPSPPMAARIIENCELNQVQVELHAYALAQHCAAAAFFANATGNPGMSTLHPCQQTNYEQRFYVATLSAESIINQKLAPAPTAMIVDAEGAELEIMRGFGPAVQSSQLERIVIEAPNDLLSASVACPLLTLLLAAGFEIQKLARTENTAHALSNFLAIRGSRDGRPEGTNPNRM